MQNSSVKKNNFLETTSRISNNWQDFSYLNQLKAKNFIIIHIFFLPENYWCHFQSRNRYKEMTKPEPYCDSPYFSNEFDKYTEDSDINANYNQYLGSKNLHWHEKHFDRLLMKRGFESQTLDYNEKKVQELDTELKFFVDSFRRHTTYEISSKCVNQIKELTSVVIQNRQGTLIHMGLKINR